MGTKANPGKYDCYAKAEHHEPLFVLLARDEDATAVIAYWIMLKAKRAGYDKEKLLEAGSCISAMHEWQFKNDYKHNAVELDKTLTTEQQKSPMFRVGHGDEGVE